MIAALLAAVVDEGKWLTFSMSLAAGAVALLWRRLGGRSVAASHRVLAAMNLGAGVMIGTMAVGHLLAVSVKLWLGTLRPGSLLAFYAIGLVLLAPSWLVGRHTAALLADPAAPRGATVGLHAWLAGTLLALGVHNLPLAAPSLFTIAYRLHARPVVGWAIVGAAAVCMVGLFAASLVFLASGQSFEQFRGVE